MALRLPVRIAERLSHPEAAALVEAECDRLTHFRFGGDQLDLKAILHAHLRQVFGRVRQQVPEDWAFIATFCEVAADGQRGGKGGFLIVKDKVIKVHVAPAGLAGIGDANENLPAGLVFEIHRHALHVLAILATGAEKHFARGFLNDVHFHLAASANEKADPWMEHFKTRGSQRAGALVAAALVNAEPELAGMLRVAALANGDRVALNRLFVPGVAFDFPAFERAFFEAEIEFRRRLDE